MTTSNLEQIIADHLPLHGEYRVGNVGCTCGWEALVQVDGWVMDLDLEKSKAFAAHVVAAIRDSGLAVIALPERVDEQYPETLAVAKAIYECLPSEDPDCGVEPWEQLTDDQRAPFLMNARNLGHVFPDQYPKLAAELDLYRAAQVAERNNHE